MGEKVIKNIKLDIFLVFPPLIEDVPMPPAGIPYLTSYLKSKGYNVSVLDLNQLYKKSFFLYRFLLCIETKVLSFRQSGLNAKQKSCDLDQAGGRVGIKLFVKQIIKKMGSRLLVSVRRLKNSIFGFDSLSLDQIFKIFNKTAAYAKMEKWLSQILKKDQKEGRIILGISAVYPNQILCALVIAKMAKEINKDVFIVLGGSQVTAHIEKFINNNDLLDFVDGFIVHEGEVGLCSLIEAINSDKGFNHIESFYYKEKNAYKPSEEVDFVMNVKEYVTPDFSGFDLKDYPETTLPLRTLRGCFWGRCVFCSYSKTSGKFDLTSPEEVVNSMKRLKERYGINRFEFVDSSMPAIFQRRIAERIVKDNINVEWLSRANFQEDFKNAEHVKLLKKSGCLSLSMGVESGNNRIIKLMGKTQKDKDSVVEIIKTIRSQDIHVIIYAMIGFPTETREEIEETIDFVLMLKRKYQCGINAVSIFNLVEGAPIFENPENYHITNITPINKRAIQGYGHEYDISEGASRKEINHLYKKANFCLRHLIWHDVIKKIGARGRY